MGHLNNVPWIPRGAVKVVEKHMSKIKNPWIFEWGSGSNTIYWARRGFNVISVEHNQKWHETVVNELRRSRLAAQVKLAKRPYHKSIDCTRRFDVILIDGRDRVKCASNAICHLGKNGIILLDDSQREWYSQIFTMFGGMTHRHFFDNEGKRRCTVWYS